MTRKHFEALANALAETRPEPLTPQYDQWLSCVRAVADTCGEFNERFNRQRFIATATLEHQTS